MRLRDRVALWALLTIGLCGCTRTKDVRAEEHATLQETRSATHDNTVDEKRASSSAETLTKAPTDVESKSDTRELAVEVQAPDGSLTLARVSRAHPLKLAAGSKVIGSVPVVERTGQRDEHRGGSVDEKQVNGNAEKHAEAKGASSAALAATDDKKLEEKTTTRWGPPWWVWALLAAGVAGAAWAAWRFSLPGRVFGWLKKL